MPTKVTPVAYHLATTKVVQDGVDSFLSHIGAGDWKTDTTDDAALLTEVAGRACYRSFGPGLNKNVTRVREGNDRYIRDGILAQKHGSVLEHAYDTFAFVDVSRVVTHELVRHRAGTAFSQESGRYVRVDAVRYYEPGALSDGFLEEVWTDLVNGGRNPGKLEAFSMMARDKFYEAMRDAERAVRRLEDMLGLDHLNDFGLKKKLQSAIRRVAPEGMASLIIVTANQRAWRHITSMRVSPAAEEEIRLIQWQVFQKLREVHPAIYQDAVVSHDQDVLPADVPSVNFINEKV